MENGHHIFTSGRGHRTWLAIAIYAVGGWTAVQLLLAARAESGLPDALDTGFIGVFVAGFVATILLMKTRIAGGGPAIFHALRALAVALVIAAMGLLVAHWVERGSSTVHAHAVLQQQTNETNAPVIIEAKTGGRADTQGLGSEDRP